MDLKEIERRLLGGGKITYDEALTLVNWENLDELCELADKVRQQYCGSDLDSCSIVNARSGVCGEDCKWCAQSVRHHTGCLSYDFLPEEEVMKAARANESHGVKRFSLVTSGRKISDHDLPRFCALIKRLSQETDLYLCASMGLLEQHQLEQLAAAGLERYHCNMESSEDHFKTLCSSHTPEDKKRTIRAARNAGLEVCSGGIIGMGESVADRVRFAFELAELDVDSVPINVLTPIKGTPMENQPLISEEEIIRTVAIFRLILPAKTLRFAGGRARISEEAQKRILRGGMNGAMIGDLLTTGGNALDSDKKIFAETGFNF